MKVVLDTNVLVSGIFFGGVPGKILDAWTEGKFELLLTPGIFDEYRDALKALGGKEAAHLVSAWIQALGEHTHHVLDPKSYPRICRDPHDDKFLYCAASVKADYLVTGDKDLKSLKGSYDFQIVSPRTFLNILEK